MPIRYDKNVAGDFYVSGEGCCTLCGMPEAVAPDFFDSDKVQCFVKRQPQTSDEITTVLEAFITQEFDCVRYGGSDSRIIQRLLDANEGDMADNSAQVQGLKARLRSYVRFRCGLTSPSEVITRLIEEPRTLVGYDGKKRFRFKTQWHGEKKAVLKLAWYREVYHAVTVTREDDGRFFITASPLYVDSIPGMSRLVHDWMTALPALSDVTWMTKDEMYRGEGQPEPY